MNRARRWALGLGGLGSAIAPQGALPLPIRGVQVADVATPTGAPSFSLRGNLTQGGVVIGNAPAGTISVSFDGDAVPFAPDGSFLIAFDRDAGSSAELAATLADGRIVSRMLSISPRIWKISRLPGLPKLPVPTPEFDKVRPGEVAQITAALRIQSDAQGWRQSFLWPATGRISTLFGSQRIYKNGEAGSYHSGIDIAVPTGTPVLAPADGQVILVSDHAFTLEGNLLMIDHGMGLSSALMHLSAIAVAPGRQVKRGQVIAWSGRTGRVTGPHLHWSLRWRNAKVDPFLVAGPMPAAGSR